MAAIATLTYSAIASIDGYVADADGRLDWAVPDDEVHAYVNELERPIGTYLYGRRMYEVMSAWETMPLEDKPQVARDFAGIWRAAEKIVYSSTLAAPSTSRTRLKRSFDPDAVQQLKETSRRDLSVGGPTLAASALSAGLVDEFHLFLVPILVGGGTMAFPDGIHFKLELVGEHRFHGGFVHLHYRAGR